MSNRLSFIKLWKNIFNGYVFRKFQETSCWKGAALHWVPHGRKRRGRLVRVEEWDRHRYRQPPKQPEVSICSFLVTIKLRLQTRKIWKSVFQTVLFALEGVDATLHFSDLADKAYKCRFGKNEFLIISSKSIVLLHILRKIRSSIDEAIDKEENGAILSVESDGCNG